MKQLITVISLFILFCQVGVFYSFATPNSFVDGESNQLSLELCSCRVDSLSLSSQEKSIAIAQMNQCVESLSRIIESKSRLVLINELDALINQLDTEHADNVVIGFRKRICNALTTLIINEEDKLRIQRMAEEELSDAVLQSVSDALGQPWVTTNGVSAIITTAKTAAQSVINYNLSVKKIQRAADKDLWIIEKNNLKVLGELRTEAIGFTHDMMKNYGLKECYKITESEATQLSEALSKDDPAIRLVSLQSLYSQRSYQESIGYYAPYWYFLGDTFIKLGKLKEGFDAYEKYLEMNTCAPIFRKNTYGGLICLDKIQLKEGLSDEEKKLLLESITYNLSDNGPAIIIAASNYYSINESRKATDLLCNSLVSKTITCKNEIVRTLANYYDYYCTSQDLRNLVFKAINNTKDLSLSTILDFYYAIKDEPNGKQELGLDRISLTAQNYLKTVSTVSVTYPSHINGNLDDVYIFTENRESTFSKREKGKKYYVYKDLLRGNQWIEKKEILKFEYFENHANDIEYLFKYMSNEWYMFRENIDLSSVRDGAGLPDKIYDGLQKDQNSKENFNKLQELWDSKQNENQYVFSAKGYVNSIDDFPFECKMLPNSPADYEIALVVNIKSSPIYVLKYSGKWGHTDCEFIDIYRYDEMYESY